MSCVRAPTGRIVRVCQAASCRECWPCYYCLLETSEVSSQLVPFRSFPNWAVVLAARLWVCVDVSANLDQEKRLLRPADQYQRQSMSTRRSINGSSHTCSLRDKIPQTTMRWGAALIAVELTMEGGGAAALDKHPAPPHRPPHRRKKRRINKSRYVPCVLIKRCK